MPTNYQISVENLDARFIASIREQFPSGEVEITVRPGAAEKGMTDLQFWQLIDLLDWSKIGDDDAVLEPLVTVLADGQLPKIYQFQDYLSEKLHLLDRREVAENIGQGAWRAGRSFSADQFLGARCCVVANGRKLFDAVMESPKKMPKNKLFDPILRAAGMAYLRKTGEIFRYVPAWNIETFSNKKGWMPA